MDAMKTGEFLAALRRSHGYTQQQVAEQLNLSNKTISKWESGGGFPDVTVLPALAELYGVTADDILAGERLHRAEEQSTAARHNYLLSRTALRFKICYVIAVVLSFTGIFSSVFGGIAGLSRDYSFFFPNAGWWGILISTLLILIGEILAHYGLQSAADICTEDEISDARLTFIRQGFSLFAMIALLASTYLCVNLISAILPIALLLVIWYFLHRLYGRIFSLGYSILLLLACVSAVLYSLCHVVWGQFTIGLLLLIFSLSTAGVVALRQILSGKSLIGLLKEKNAEK